MRRTIVVSVMLALVSCGTLDAATGVRVEGVFVEATTSAQTTQVEVGQDVRLVVRVTDISDSPLGMSGGCVDVGWDSTVLELQDAVDDTETTTADVAALFDNPWIRFFTGVKTGAGALDNVGAGQMPPFDRMGGATVDFFTLTFRALKTGQVTPTLAGHDFGLFGQTQLAGSYEAVSATLTVVDAPGPGTTPTPIPPATGATCFPQAAAVGVLMAAGCGGMIRRRRQDGPH